MLVTFKTKAYPNITMFGDVAVRLLKLMGHSGTVPSAIVAADVPASLDRLRAAMADEKRRAAAAKPATGDEETDEPPVSLATRAVPLIELFEAAAAEGNDVMWEG